MNDTVRKNYDSEFCGSLPLHLINLIQPYGVLMVLDKAGLNIVQVSENLQELLPVSPMEAVNTSFSDYIPQSQFERLKTLLEERKGERLPLNFTFGDKDYQTLVHTKDQYILIEIDKYPRSRQSSFIDVFQTLKHAMALIEQASTTSEVCNTAIKELKNLSGFDKIMIYQFDADWNGMTIAEISELGMTEYLGLHFPASDIPKQARDLYLKNPYRLIPSREYKPVRLYPVINPITGAFIDLSDCNLRSVPAVHLEYLKNMEVMASMSTRILKDGGLWGLISCHHRTEKYLDQEMCALFELMSNIISAKISAIQHRESASFQNRLKEIQSKLMQQLYQSKDLYEGLFNKEVNMLSLLNAGGAALVNPRQIRTIGNAPSRDQIRDMVYWLQNSAQQEVYHVSNLQDVYEPGFEFSDVASGIIAIPIAKGEYIIGFRPEVIQEVNWGGNPNEAINFEKDSITYHPRNSFRLWQQVVKNTSLPWLPEEVMVARDFSSFVWNTKT